MRDTKVQVTQEGDRVTVTFGQDSCYTVLPSDSGCVKVEKNGVEQAKFNEQQLDSMADYYNGGDLIQDGVGRQFNISNTDEEEVKKIIISAIHYWQLNIPRAPQDTYGGQGGQQWPGADSAAGYDGAGAGPRIALGGAAVLSGSEIALLKEFFLGGSANYKPNDRAGF